MAVDARWGNLYLYGCTAWCFWHPFGCEAVVIAKHGLYLTDRSHKCRDASQRGKRPRHWKVGTYRFITVMRNVFHEKHRS